MTSLPCAEDAKAELGAALQERLLAVHDGERLAAGVTGGDEAVEHAPEQRIVEAAGDAEIAGQVHMAEPADVDPVGLQDRLGVLDALGRLDECNEHVLLLALAMVAIGSPAA